MTDISFLGDSPLERLENLMAQLRAPQGGCAWDIEQTFETIAPYTLEEAYEVYDAIQKGDMVSLREELGDLLFQVIFHARMAEEIGQFDVTQVCDDLTRKMVRRHPHVFQAKDDRTAEEQTAAWEAIKAEERASKGTTDPVSILDGVALALPALTRAEKLQKRAARTGFDWPDLTGVIEKISEEAAEVADAAKSNNPHKIEDEIGDLLFAVTNLARRLNVDPEKALRRTNAKFSRRFTYIESQGRASGRPIEGMDLNEMEALWKTAKESEA